MTNNQFTALASLLQLRTGPASAAARCVLVDGERQIDVAKGMGMSTAAVSNVVGRCTRGLALACQAAGCPADSPKIPQKTPQAAPLLG